MPAAQAREDLPLSACQRGYLLDTGGEPGDPVHNTALPLWFAQPIDAGLLRTALAQVMRRHSMLRAVIDIGDDGARQRILVEPSGWWREVDATGMDRDAVLARAQIDLRQAFELDRGLFRATLYYGSEVGILLLLAQHHVATDAASWGIIGRELLTCCAALSDRREVELPPLETDYGDYIRWEQELLTTKKGEQMAAYWTRALADLGPVLDLPTDAPRASIKTSSGRSQGIALTPELIQGVYRTAAALQTSRYAVLLTAYLMLLHKRSGQSDLWVLVPSSMPRQKTRFSTVVGLLVSPLVVRSRISEANHLAFSCLVREVNGQLLQGLHHQPYPVTQLAGHTPGGTVPVRTMSAWERSDFIPRTFTADDLRAERCDLAQLEGLFDLGMTFLEDREGQGIFAAMSHNADLFTPQTADDMATQFLRMLGQIARDAEH